MDRTESDSPRRELFSGGLESVVTLLVHLQINYSCASPGKAIQLYVHMYIDSTLCLCGCCYNQLLISIVTSQNFRQDITFWFQASKVVCVPLRCNVSGFSLLSQHTVCLMLVVTASYSTKILLFFTLQVFNWLFNASNALSQVLLQFSTVYQFRHFVFFWFCYVRRNSCWCRTVFWRTSSSLNQKLSIIFWSVGRTRCVTSLSYFSRVQAEK